MKKTLRRILNSIGFEFSRIKPNEFGCDPLPDMTRILGREAQLIFDVGANVGQSIAFFRSRFPNSEIHSFEPSPETFQLLSQNYLSTAGVSIWNHALGACPETRSFNENSNRDMSSFLSLSDTGWGEVTKATDVAVVSVDDFCEQQNIGKIDILKSDTQGFDLEVLKGSSSMMKEDKIGIVYLEVIFSDMYKDLPSFAETFSFLQEHGFSLVTLYDMHFQNDRAGWADAMFVSNAWCE